MSSATVTLTGIGSCTITASQAGNDDFNPAADVQRSFTIAQATTTLSLSNLVHTYDGSPKSATVIAGAANVTGITVTYNGSSSAPVAAGTYAVEATLVHPDYSAAPATGTLVINPAAVTITPAGAKTKAYGVSFTAFTGAIAGLEGSDAVEVTYASAGAAPGSAVGSYDITVASHAFTAGTASNYTVSTGTAAGGLTVTAATLTITPDGGKTKTYGQMFSAFTGAVSGLASGDQLTASYASTGTPASAGAGIHDITVGSYAFTTGSATNYTIVTGAAAGGLTVTPANLTITPDDGKTKSYGETFAAFTGVVTGLANGDQLTASYASTGAAAGSSIGSYDITVASHIFTSGTSSNYTVATSTAAGGLTVTKASLTITPHGGKQKTYGQTFTAFTGVVTGLASGDQVEPVYTSAGAAASAGAGSYAITVASYAFTTGAASNYAVSTGAAAGGLTVDPASLTIAADPKGKLYLEPLPAFTVQHNGFVNGDTPGVLTGTTDCASLATAASSIGTYPITCSGQSSPNYAVAYVPSTLTIAPRPMAAAVTVHPGSVQYQRHGDVLGLDAEPGRRGACQPNHPEPRRSSNRHRNPGGRRPSVHGFVRVAAVHASAGRLHNRGHVRGPQPELRPVVFARAAARQHRGGRRTPHLHRAGVRRHRQREGDHSRSRVEGHAAGHYRPAG